MSINSTGKMYSVLPISESGKFKSNLCTMYWRLVQCTGAISTGNFKVNMKYTQYY